LNKKPNDGMETKTLLETFRYPRLGPGMMWDAAKAHVEAKGNQVLMGPQSQAARAGCRRQLAGQRFYR